MSSFPSTGWRLIVAIALASSSITAIQAQASPADKQAPNAADDALLAKAGTLYYSTAKSGLAGFDCQIHPDWDKLFASANHGADLTPVQQQRVALLKTVAVAIHAKMDGSATLDWNPPQTSDADSTSLLEQMHQATNQTLTGFVQFWAPFVNGTLIPANAQGATVKHDAGSFSVHTDSTDSHVTEVFSDSLLLEKIDIVTGGSSMKFEPTYRQTADGLLVEHFIAHIQSMGPPPGPDQELHVGIDYQTIIGFPIPAQLNLEVVGTGVFNFALDGCTATRK